jgi:predicted HTH domain antitoxin
MDGSAILTMTINIPDEIANELGTVARDVERRVVEAIAVEGYRSGRFSIGFVGRILGLSLWDAETFLDRRGARHPYTADMLREDRDSLGRSSAP